MLDSSKKDRNEAEGSVVAEYPMLHDTFFWRSFRSSEGSWKKIQNSFSLGKQLSVTECLHLRHRCFSRNNPPSESYMNGTLVQNSRFFLLIISWYLSWINKICLCRGREEQGFEKIGVCRTLKYKKDCVAFSRSLTCELLIQDTSTSVFQFYLGNKYTCLNIQCAKNITNLVTCPSLVSFWRQKPGKNVNFILQAIYNLTSSLMSSFEWLCCSPVYTQNSMLSAYPVQSSFLLPQVKLSLQEVSIYILLLIPIFPFWLQMWNKRMEYQVKIVPLQKISLTTATAWGWFLPLMFDCQVSLLQIVVNSNNFSY